MPDIAATGAATTRTAVTTPPALEVTGLTKHYGGVKALEGVSFAVGRGELVALIGPNGSGKSTAIDCITGFTRPSAGRVTVDGRPVRAGSPQRLAAIGVIRTFQTVRVFGTLTVRQNVALGAFASSRHRLLRYVRRPDSGVMARVDEAIESFNLTRVASQNAGEISYGQRKLVEFAAAMVREPDVLLLDEPAAGLSAGEVAELAGLIRETARHSLVILVEHNLKVIYDLCDTVTLILDGEVAETGSPAQMRESALVAEAYLGVPVEAGARSAVAPVEARPAPD